MEEKLFEVVENGRVIASYMSWDIALALLEGYRAKYYLQPMNLTIKEMDRTIKDLDRTISSEDTSSAIMSTEAAQLSELLAKFKQLKKVSNSWNNKKMSEYEALVEIRNILYSEN